MPMVYLDHDGVDAVVLPVPALRHQGAGKWLVQAHPPSLASERFDEGAGRFGTCVEIVAADADADVWSGVVRIGKFAWQRHTRKAMAICHQAALMEINGS